MANGVVWIGSVGVVPRGRRGRDTWTTGTCHGDDSDGRAPSTWHGYGVRQGCGVPCDLRLRPVRPRAFAVDCGAGERADPINFLAALTWCAQ